MSSENEVEGKKSRGLDVRTDWRMETGVDDAQVELALANFRKSVRGWSEIEFARPRAVQPARRGVSWWVVRHMGAAWALAGVLTVTGVSVPVGVRFQHEHALMAARKAAEDAAQKAEQARIAELKKQAPAMDDEAFLQDVDSDVAQDTPDAMEPLASLMSESSSR